MQINVQFENTSSDFSRKGPVNIGWLFSEKKSSIVFEAPRRVKSVDVNREHAKSASRCPAIINLESRYFEIPCPFDLELELVRDKSGKPALRDRLGQKNPTRAKMLNKHLNVTSESEWRYKDRPTIQISLPYIFITDEPVYLSQVAPFMHFPEHPWPGTIFGGRFPINVWPRPLMFAFEWHDTSKPLILKRGQPLFYVMFETLPQDRPVRLVEASDTPELREYLDLISGAVNYVNQTFSLFSEAEKRRPAKLLREVDD